MRRLRETFVRRVARISAEDAGFVALVVAICLPVFIALLAFAVDVSNWYLVQNKEQKAADNASLGGVIYLPSDPCTAYSTAFAVAGLNGFATNYNPATCSNSVVGPASAQDAKKTFTVTVQLGAKPGELQVTIVKTVNNAFASIPLLNDPKTNVGKSATAAFSGPANLGSPCNVLGNQAMESGSNLVQTNSQCAADGSYWLNMAGYNVNKSRGDALGSGWCTVPDDGVAIDGCASTRQTSGNVEHQNAGYLYDVHVPSGMSGVHIQVYDGEYAEVGDHCDLDSAEYANATTVTNPYVTDQNVRYANSAGNKFCSGDNADCPDAPGPNPPCDPSKQTDYTQSQDDKSPVETTYTIYNTPTSPSDPLSGGKLATCTVPQVKGYSGSQILAAGGFQKLLNAKSPNYSAQLAQYFQRWTDLCSNLSGPNDYVIQVQTTANTGAQGGGGQNRFSLRAYSSGNNNGLSVSALQIVSLNVNANTGSTFHVVRLDSGAAGHTLTIGLFDFGDGATTTATIHTPDNSSNAWNPATACIGAAYPGNTGSQVTTGVLSGCKWTTTASVSGGRWQNISIAIPANYQCNQSTQPADCWVTITLTASGALDDTTTWSARLSGDPVRLVQ